MNREEVEVLGRKVDDMLIKWRAGIFEPKKTEAIKAGYADILLLKPYELQILSLIEQNGMLPVCELARRSGVS